MKAVVINQYGGKDRLQEAEVPIPSIQDHQVLVQMKATSVNPIDWKLREGYLKDMLPFDFPIILGWDAAGIITETGKSVKNFKVGDAVFARPDTTRNGTYAEFVAIDEDKLALKPPNVSFEEAASVPLAGLTAWQGLYDVLGLKAGEKILIHAGAGGVGSLAIQFAHHTGAYVATTASAENGAFVKNLGADMAIDYRTEHFEEILKDFDAVYDTLGGRIQSGSYQILKKGGRLVSIAEAPKQEEAEKYGVKADFLWLQPNGKQLAEIGELLQSGTVKAIVGQTFPFSQQGVREAHALSESHHARGKIVITF
ncbi:NADP-dependent oxidoreductase [Heyndrickxia acidiproducens]|uniref:NADP-dependent oxidoreductase n=1 Tax=Heyndrickxia acidiproducens TaxID=1121084 RepID=UPI00035D6F04|nr:NADP-dependent oxidoreductase [Heyndrickxia acidiproducens]